MGKTRRPGQEALGDAERAVRRARGRLGAALGLDWAMRGGLVGAAAGLAAAGVVHLAGGVPGMWLLALPVAGAAAAVVMSIRRRPGIASAALALDAAAGSDEAFVSALSARDAAPEIRALSAEYALDRCTERDVPRLLAIPTPAAAAAAVLATAALCAVVLVPASRDTPHPRDDAQAPITVPVRPAQGQGSAAADVSPATRAARLVDAAQRGDSGAVRDLSPEVRGDLAAVSDDDLRAVAEALAAGGASAARDALERLAAGDRAGAIDALRRALGFRDAGSGAGVPGGTAAGATGGPGGVGADPRLPASWPLRYDRELRQWLAMQNENRREERK